MKHSLILLMLSKSFACFVTSLTIFLFESLKCLGSFVPWYDAHALQTPRRYYLRILICFIVPQGKHDSVNQPLYEPETPAHYKGKCLMVSRK